MLFFIGRGVCILHTSTISKLTNPLFLDIYLQQNITQMVSLTLSKAVQQLSIIYPHTTINIQTWFTTQYNSYHYSKFISQFNHLHIASLFSQQFIFLDCCISTHPIQHATVLTSSVMPLNLCGAYRHIRPNTRLCWPRLSCHSITSNRSSWCCDKLIISGSLWQCPICMLL